MRPLAGTGGEAGWSVGFGEVAAPIFRGGNGEHRFELHFIVDFESNGLGSMASALAVVILHFVPVDAGGAGPGDRLCLHDVLGNGFQKMEPFLTLCKER
jgi:hypothetical protein